jgi:hypothetical protein
MRRFGAVEIIIELYVESHTLRWQKGAMCAFFNNRNGVATLATISELQYLIAFATNVATPGLFVELLFKLRCQSRYVHFVLASRCEVCLIFKNNAHQLK